MVEWIIHVCISHQSDLGFYQGPIKLRLVYMDRCYEYLFSGVTIQHSVDVVRLLIFPYMKYKSHLTFFFQVKKSVNSRN